MTGRPSKLRGELAGVGIDVVDIADIAVINFLVVVVLDLHHLVAGRKGPAEALDLAIARRVQGRLQFDIERARPDAAAIHRAKHLDIANRIKSEPLGDPCLHQLDDARHGSFRIVRRHEVEVAVRRWAG